MTNLGNVNDWMAERQWREQQQRSSAEWSILAFLLSWWMQRKGREMREAEQFRAYQDALTTVRYVEIEPGVYRPVGPVPVAPNFAKQRQDALRRSVILYAIILGPILLIMAWNLYHRW